MVRMSKMFRSKEDLKKHFMTIDNCTDCFMTQRLNRNLLYFKPRYVNMKGLKNISFDS